jgi:peptide deformylase
MSILPILCYPDPRLHTVAKPVAKVDDRIRQLVETFVPTLTREVVEQAVRQGVEPE